jgi:GTP-binding protein HflX
VVEWAKAAPGARLNQAYPVDEAEEFEEADQADDEETADGDADSLSDSEADSSPTPNHVGSH